MTLTTEQVNEICHSSFGTSAWHKRTNSTGMVYTDGVMYFQTRCNAYWFIDLMYSHMPAVLKDYKETEEGIYFVHLTVNTDNTATVKIVREEHDTELEETKEVEVVAQDIPYTDLPPCHVTMYLELCSLDPLAFCLLMPSEH